MFESGYIAAFWFLLLGALTPLLLLGLGFFIRPKRTVIGKGALPYECGEEPVGSPWVKFNIRFYVVAIIYIIFDVEMAAIFPVVVLYKEAVVSGTAALIFSEIFLFIGLLAVGLVYCWVRGDLEWVKGLSKARNPTVAA